MIPRPMVFDKTWRPGEIELVTKGLRDETYVKEALLRWDFLLF